MARYYRVEYDIQDADAMTRLLDPEHRQVSSLWVGTDDETRRGVSCCRSLDDLVAYFSDRQWTCASGTRVLVLAGEETDEEDWDADEGSVLIYPTRIIQMLTLAEAGLDGVGEPVQND